MAKNKKSASKTDIEQVDEKVDVNGQVSESQVAADVEIEESEIEESEIEESEIEEIADFDKLDELMAKTKAAKAKAARMDAIAKAEAAEAGLKENGDTEVTERQSFDDDDDSDEGTEARHRMPAVTWFSGSVDEMYIGTVSKFKEDGGFGFLQLETGTLYFHIKQHRPPIVSGDRITLGKVETPNIEKLAEGTRVYYVIGKHARGPFASAWCFKDDVDALKKQYIEQPMYRLTIKVTMFTPLKANNVTKKFEQEIIEEKTETVWCGTDILDARFHMKTAIVKYSSMSNVKFQFYHEILNDDSEWVPCNNFIRPVSSKD